MKKCRFSVVVPVYQAERYLEECIASVLAQDFESWELILVDDGSVDKSPEICKKNAAISSRIRVIRKKNEGPLLARYTGFCASAGEYIVSLDADDRLVPGALRTLSDIIEKEACDLVIYNYCRIDSKGERTGKRSSIPAGCFGQNKKPDLLGELWRQNTFNLIWNKAFKREYVKYVLPEEKKLRSIVNGDDGILITPVLARAGKTVSSDRVLYEYRMTEGSITRRFQMRKAEEFFAVRDYMKNIFSMEGLWTPDVGDAFFRMVYQNTAYLLCGCARSKEKYRMKKQFYMYLRRQRFYRQCLLYKGKVPFSLIKKWSLGLFEDGHELAFTVSESIQGFLSGLRMLPPRILPQNNKGKQ